MDSTLTPFREANDDLRRCIDRMTFSVKADVGLKAFTKSRPTQDEQRAIEQLRISCERFLNQHRELSEIDDIIFLDVEAISGVLDSAT